MKTDTIIPVYNLPDRSGAGFIISNNQCEESSRAHPDLPHRHTNYTIELLRDGEITHQIDFDRYTVKAPAILLIAPEQVHQQDPQTDYEVTSISFSKEFVLRETDNMLACWECMFRNGAVNITWEQLEELDAYAHLMYREYASNRVKKDIVIKNLLSAFIISCVRMMRKGSVLERMDPIQNNIVRSFTELVNNHFSQKTQVASYAEMLYVTPGHLNDTIKSATGKTAKQIIDDRRIMEAKRLLFWGTHTVKEIAWQLNFEDDGYFNRFFKKHTGSTPALFQRTILNKYN